MERRGRLSAFFRRYRKELRGRISRVSRRSRSPSRRRSRSTARDRRERRSYKSSDSGRSTSRQAFSVPSLSVARSSVIPSPGDLVIPAVCGVVVVDGTKLVISDSTAPRPATATELALRVIPLINNIKTQLVDVQLALDVLPAIQLATKELKDGYVALDRKYGSLAYRLVKTDVAVKILDDWCLLRMIFHEPKRLVCHLQ